jgi:hypothetical protein
MPLGIEAMSAAKGPGGLIYVAGGFWIHSDGFSIDETATDSLYVFDPVLKTVQARAKLSSARGHFGLVSTGNGWLYAIGGNDCFEGRCFGTSYPGMTEVEAYSTSLDQWWR